MVIKNERGVTLVELLAVLAVIGMILGLILFAQSTWSSETKALQQQMLEQDKLRFAVETLVRDIEASETITITPGIIQVGQTFHTLQVEILLKSGVVSVYNFDIVSGDFTLTRGDVNAKLAINLEKFFLDPQPGDWYILDFILNEPDHRLGTNYQILTIARPIDWN